MPILTFRDTSIAFGGPALLNKVTFSIEPGERIALVGRNGEGKSTMLKMISGELEPDSGEIIKRSGLKVARMQQEVPADLAGTTLQVVLGTLGPAALDELDPHHSEYVLAAETALSRLGLDGTAEASSLSGGQKRRVLLAAALAQEPDLLVLDEPTNHLDIPTIGWMEQMLARLQCAILFVTHDRAFLRRLATRIVELDRGNLSSWDCGWDQYRERRDGMFADEERANALFDKRLAEEEVWIRKGIKARRTRNEGRVRALERMRLERSQRRGRPGQVQMEVAEAEKSGRMVVRCKGLAYQWPAQPVVNDFDCSIARGDRVGIVGPNGSGKTTLLRLLLGELMPQAGEVKLGTNLSIAYFDQLRSQLRLDETLIENIGDGKEYIEFAGAKRHVLSYLQDFLFHAERARGPISALSGGERNRLLLARIFSRPSNVMVLDEPTNDLDMETLDLLEDRLAEYTGTVLIVSHDREFLDRVCTSVLALEAPGSVKEYVGGYTDWVRQGGSLERYGASADKASDKTTDKNTDNISEASVNDPSGKNQKKKLSYKEQRELEGLPGLIEKLEADSLRIQTELADPKVFTNHVKLVELQNALATAEAGLLKAYARWEELGA